MTAEFGLIARYFTKAAPSALLGVGDDCALIEAATSIATSMDMLVEGTHFSRRDDPLLLGRKALSVNLSDLAAMGAKPRWALLALALPEADENWLSQFSQGFFEVAERHGVDLVGGDTTRGPLTICIQVMGEVDAGRALRRDGAAAGEDIWVSGELGDAALGLAHVRGEVVLDGDDVPSCLQALHNPAPRVDLGLALGGISRCAIDISDGFCADLSHVLERSQVSAVVDYAALPASKALEKYRQTPIGQQAILSGGDDYELCFTASPAKRDEIEALQMPLGIRLTRVGSIGEGEGLTVLDARGGRMQVTRAGYEHFSQT